MALQKWLPDHRDYKYQLLLPSLVQLWDVESIGIGVKLAVIFLASVMLTVEAELGSVTPPVQPEKYNHPSRGTYLS